MILYWAVPFLLVAAPPIIVLISVLIGGCTMTEDGRRWTDEARFYSDPRRGPAKSCARNSIGARSAPNCGASSTGRRDDL